MTCEVCGGAHDTPKDWTDALRLRNYPNRHDEGVALIIAAGFKCQRLLVAEVTALRQRLEAAERNHLRDVNLKAAYGPGTPLGAHGHG